MAPAVVTKELGQSQPTVMSSAGLSPALTYCQGLPWLRMLSVVELVSDGILYAVSKQLQSLLYWISPIW